MKTIVAWRVLGLATLLLTTACSGADDVTRPRDGCAFWDEDSVDKNGPCEPCDMLQSDPDRVDKNKPCIPEEEAVPSRRVADR